ncbi:hypothetical protein Bpfe_023320 [Biomphalaria pfeifferi]|uniref:Uncharacterized protein n=1 Tax=Biomphalaria pfeifferi TaxID=112525 RepID=A0AAD8B343_BIOPF|nr:hypothetical protein Bpfe_023320 [Biomphalaria pfeifferi]
MRTARGCRPQRDLKLLQYLEESKGRFSLRDKKLLHLSEDSRWRSVDTVQGGQQVEVCGHCPRRTAGGGMWTLSKEDKLSRFYAFQNSIFPPGYIST